MCHRLAIALQPSLTSPRHSKTSKFWLAGFVHDALDWCFISLQHVAFEMHSAYPSQQVDMSWLSTINHTSSFCYGASCCPWLEFACENGGSRSRSRYVSRSQADTGQHLRPSEVAQCAKAFVHPAIAWGFRGNFVEISDGFADLSFWIQYNACDVWLLYCIIYRLVLGGGTDSKTQLQLHVPGWRKIRREEKSKGHDGHDSQSIPDPYGYPAIHTGSRVKGVFGMCLVSRILWSASLKIRASMQDVLVVCFFLSFDLSMICPYLL